MAVPPRILSIVALLSNKYDGVGPEGPGIAGLNAPGLVLSWQCCSLLGHLVGGPYWDSFCCSSAS